MDIGDAISEYVCRGDIDAESVDGDDYQLEQ